MKKLIMLVVVGAVCLCVPAFAGSPKDAEINGLRNAYIGLVRGDHDYKGHRARALKHVETAAQHLGLNISGDGKARQPQKNSDADLAGARAALVPVLDIAKSQGQPLIEKEVAAAIKEIDIALKIR